MTSLAPAARRALLAGACAFAALLAWPGRAQAAAPIEHFTLPSGAQVWFAASPSIPMLDVQIDFDAGSRRDPAAKAGLADATALMLTKGVRAEGRQLALDENRLGEAWADLGARFAASASSDRLSIRLRSLTDEALLPRAVALAAREIAEPAFAPAVWARERERMSAAIAESLTRPGPVAQRAFDAAVYGGHPYGRDATPQSLAAITVADMKALHQQALAACRAKVSLVGSISREQAGDIAARLLARLPQSGKNGECAPLPAVPEVPPLKKAEQIDIPFQSAQAHVLIGQPGHKRSDPDYFALLVGNHVLGGNGFSSLLMNEVREKRGLSYGAYSHFQPALHAGAFSIGLQTRPDQAAQAVQVARQVLQDFVQQGPTEAQLKAAKDNLIGGFALRMDSNASLLAQVSNIAWNGLPDDYLDTWTRQVELVSASDVKAAFARVLQPERMVTVIVGPKTKAADTADAARAAPAH